MSAPPTMKMPRSARTAPPPLTSFQSWTGSRFMLFQRDPLILVGELVVLAERIAGPVLRQKNPPEVGMVLEADAVHVVGLALVPVGGLPEAGDALDRGLLAPDVHLEHGLLVFRDRVKMVDHPEVLGVVGAGDARQEIEMHLGIALEPAADGEERLLLEHAIGIPGALDDGDDAA